MKRSGSTLQYQITAEIVEQFLSGKRLPWVNEEQLDYELAENEVGVFKCHICTPKIEKLLNGENAKGVYSFRDIRECCSSWMRKTNNDFKAVWESKFIQECLEQYDKFSKCPNVLVSKYEDFFFDLPTEVTRIASHLEIQLSDDQAEKIAANFSLEKQKKKIEEMRRSNVSTFVHGNQVIDKNSLLHTNHITAGKIDSWKQELSNIEVALIEKVAEKWLVENGYELQRPNLSFFEKRRLKKILTFPGFF